jgi:hypothetical protein
MACWTLASDVTRHQTPDTDTRDQSKRPRTPLNHGSVTRHLQHRFGLVTFGLDGSSTAVAPQCGSPFGTSGGRTEHCLHSPLRAELDGSDLDSCLLARLRRDKDKSPSLLLTLLAQLTRHPDRIRMERRNRNTRTEGCHEMALPRGNGGNGGKASGRSVTCRQS